MAAAACCAGDVAAAASCAGGVAAAACCAGSVAAAACGSVSASSCAGVVAATASDAPPCLHPAGRRCGRKRHTPLPPPSDTAVRAHASMAQVLEAVAGRISAFHCRSLRAPLIPHLWLPSPPTPVPARAAWRHRGGVGLCGQLSFPPLAWPSHNDLLAARERFERTPGSQQTSPPSRRAPSHPPSSLAHSVTGWRTEPAPPALLFSETMFGGGRQEVSSPQW